MEEQKIEFLISKVINNTATSEDFVELAAAVKADELGVLATRIDALLRSDTLEVPGYDEEKWKRVAAQILHADYVGEEKIRAVPVRMVRRFLPYAASIVLIGGIVLYFLKTGGEHIKAKGSAPVAVVEDVMPGSNVATLTLSDGRKIELTGSNEILNDGGVKISKTIGQLMYNSTNIAAINTMSTPRGGQYKLILPDGSRVWLNAASSITYPTAFTGSERKVSITGEAYFEVSKDRNKPFKVQIGESSEIEVLGTQFNVNSYLDESSLNTTLLEGSVRITSANNVKTMLPGQQIRINRASGEVAVSDHVNIQEVVAWKNGVFQFDYADLKSVMRQLARWYDVEVIYEKGAPVSEVFFGKIQRSLSLAQVLKILQSMDVNFEIKPGKKLIVKSS